MGGQRGRSGGKRAGAGRPRKTPQARWLSGTGPRPVTVGTAAVQVTEPVAPGDVPAHWRPDVQAWYAAILESWEFGAAGLQLLLHAGECLNLELECRDAIRRDGLLVAAQGGSRKAHPLLQVSASARGQFLSLLAQLRLTE